MDETKFYILNSEGKLKEVSEDEHSEWVDKNKATYNRHWERKDGTKNLSLFFVGKKEPWETHKVIFKVSSTFKGYDGEIITHSTHSFTSYKKALEVFEDNIYNSEG